MLRKKSSFERQQDALDEIAQIRKDVDNRFAFEAPDIAKRYVEGRLEICLKFRTRRGGQEFECLFRRSGTKIFKADPIPVVRNDGQAAYGVEDTKSVHAPRATETCKPDKIDIGESISGGEVLAPSGPQHQTLPIPEGKVADRACGAQVYRDKPHPVFVAIVGGMQQPQERVPSFVRLQIPDHMNGILGKLFLFSKGGFKFTEIHTEGEPDFAFASLRNPDDDLRQHLIEGGSKIMEDFSGSHREITRNLFRELESPNFLSGLRITFGDDFVSCTCEKGFNGDIEIIDLGFGPLGLGEGRYKRRFRIHDIGSIMAKTNDLTATKNLMGALVRMKPKQHDEMKLGKTKPKKAKKPANKRASSKPKTA